MISVVNSLRHSAFGLQAQSRGCVKLVGVKGWVFDDDEEEEDADADNEAHDDEEEEEDEDDDHRDEDDVMM